MSLHRPRALVLAAALSPVLAAGSARAADAPFAGVLDVAPGSDVTFDGSAAGARAGGSVAFAGDFNGDGRQDYAISMPGAKQLDVVYGAPFPELAPLALPSERGVAIEGRTVTSVTGAGDVNGDGYDDLLIGGSMTFYSDRPGAGTAWIVFGAKDTPAGGINLPNPGARGVRIAGLAGDGLGSSVATVPDLDGDRRSDFVIGAAAGSAAYVVYSATLAGGLDLAKAGTRAYRISGVPGEAAGTAVAGVRDMNGDGLGEIAIGAPAAGGGNGAAYVTWGKSPQAAAPVSLPALGAGGFALSGAGGERAGAAVAGIGDATGDGIPDVAVGAPYSSANGRSRSGAAYIVAGRADAALAASAVRVRGGDSVEGLGTSLAPAGDVDGDGTADLAIGMSNARALDRPRAPSAIVLRTGRLPGPDVDAGLLGYAALRIAGPAPGTTGRPTLAGGTDVDLDGRNDLLLGFSQALGRGRAVLVRMPAPQDAPRAAAPVAPALASNVEAIVDDSQSMTGKDPGGLLRRQALELVLVNPANQGRIFGAVEFGTFAHQIFPPLRIGEAPLAPSDLAVLRGLLAERLRNDGGKTNFAGAFSAAAESNPGAQARVFITDGDQSSALTGFGDVPTYVIGLQLTAGQARDRLEQLARESRGDYYAVRDAGELQSALAAIDARLRGDQPVPTTVQAGAGVVPVATQRSGAAAAKVTGAKRTVDFETAPTAGTLRRRQIVLSWDRADTRFQLTRLVLAAGAAKTVRVPRKKLRNALRGKWQRVGRGLKIRGRTGRTFLVLEVRGAGRTGRRAIAAASRRRDKGRASRNGGTGTSNLNMNTYGKRNG